MRLINLPRKGGKTTQLIRVAAEGGGYIVCWTQAMAKSIFEQSKEMGLNIRFPITFDEFLNKRFYGKGAKEFYIDDVDILLAQLAQGVPVDTVTISVGAQ